MFENTTDFDFEDDILGNTFAPVFSSTQEHIAKQAVSSHLGTENEKRQIEDDRSDNAKKLKLNVSENSEECPRNNRVLSDTSTKAIFNVTRNNILKQSNIENIKSCDSTFSSPAKVVKRRFPGPAGLLPEKSSNGKSFMESIEDDSNDDIFLCSQRTLASFEDGPWAEMMRDFGTLDSGPLYEKFNINWIKKNCSAKKLLKAPFLAAIIQSVEIIHGNMATINVLLKDTTGEIEGTILSSLYEEKSKLFTSGSVIVLNQFGVLTVRNSHCLTITPNSLLVIYHLEKDVDGNPVSVKKSVMQEFKLDNIWLQTQGNIYPKDSTNCLGGDSIRKLHISPEVHQSRVNYVNSPKPSNTSDKIDPNSTNQGSSKSKLSTSEIVKESMKVFHFKKTSSEDNSSTQTDAKADINFSNGQSDKDHPGIWKDLFEDLDTEALFDEF